MILIACGGVVAALLVFGVLVTLPQLGQHSDRYIGVWQGGRGQATIVTIYKAQDGWDVVANGRALHAIDRDGQLVTTGSHAVVTLRRENDTLVMIRGDWPPVLARQ